MKVDVCKIIPPIVCNLNPMLRLFGILFIFIPYYDLMWSPHYVNSRTLSEYCTKREDTRHQALRLFDRKVEKWQ